MILGRIYLINIFDFNEFLVSPRPDNPRGSSPILAASLEQSNHLAKLQRGAGRPMEFLSGKLNEKMDLFDLFIIFIILNSKNRFIAAQEKKKLSINYGN